MGNYASAYEEYYKNINNKSKEKEIWNRKRHSSRNGSGKYKEHADGEAVFFSKEYWIRRIEIELAGSLALLSCFIALKYVNIPYTRGAYVWCRNAIVSEFNYDQSIEAFNSMEIGGYKTKDFRIGTFKIEDLKSENLKAGWNNFVQYINQLQGQSV